MKSILLMLDFFAVHVVLFIYQQTLSGGENRGT